MVETSVNNLELVQLRIKELEIEQRMLSEERIQICIRELGNELAILREQASNLQADMDRVIAHQDRVNIAVIATSLIGVYYCAIHFFSRMRRRRKAVDKVSVWEVEDRKSSMESFLINNTTISPKKVREWWRWIQTFVISCLKSS